MPNKTWKKVYNTPQLTIYSEGSDIKKTYHPHKRKEVAELCRKANISKFIVDSKKKHYPDLLLFESSRYNRGVVTNEFIKKNRIICEYRGELGSLDHATEPEIIKKILLKKAKYKKYGKKLERAIEAYSQYISAYAFEVDPKSKYKNTVLAHKKRSLAAFINHHTTDANVRVIIKNKTIYFKAARDIEKYEQLFIDYGPDYEYHEKMGYISCMENHFFPGKFLAEHLSLYYPKPVALTQKQKNSLGISSKWVILPRYFYDLIYKKKSYSISAFEKRLTLLELSSYKKKPQGYIFYVTQHQHNITPLLFAISKKNKMATQMLIKKHQVDPFSKMTNDYDALIVALNCNVSPSFFTSLLIKNTLDAVDRIDYLGCNQIGQTALHLLIEKKWHDLIPFFNRPVFFNVVNKDNFDPFLYAISKGDILALKKMLKFPWITYPKHHVFLAEETINKQHDFVIKRALNYLPGKKRKQVIDFLLKTLSKKSVYLEKRLQSLLMKN